MAANGGLALFRLFFAALCLAALVGQFTYNVQNIASYRPLNYFSFFTVESNIIATATFGLAGWYAWKGRTTQWLELLRGAATMLSTRLQNTVPHPAAELPANVR
jgi:hypothetical protein